MNDIIAIRLQNEEKEEKQRKLISAVLTFFMLVLFTAVLLIFGFQYMDPPPPEEGAMVQMGEPDAGMNDEPASQGEPEQAVTPPQEDESQETQDYEDAPEAAKTDPKNTTQTTQSTPTPKPTKPKRTFNDEFGFHSSGDGKGQGEGDGGKPGDQGDPNGQGDALSGNGYGKSGIGDFYMGNNRKPEKPISASCSFQGNFTIVVKIKIDKNGYVTATECVTKYKKFNAVGVSDQYCDCAKAAARSVKFTPKPDAPAVQEGAIKFVFRND